MASPSGGCSHELTYRLAHLVMPKSVTWVISQDATSFCVLTTGMA